MRSGKRRNSTNANTPRRSIDMDIDMAQVEMLIEIRGIYDGWSIAKMKDGTYRNRWDENDRRFASTADCIQRLIDTDARKGWITPSE